MSTTKGPRAGAEALGARSGNGDLGRARRQARKVTGTYFQPATSYSPTATLTLKPDSQDIQQYSDDIYTFGYWLAADGAVAFDVSTSQTGEFAGCIFLGEVSKHGIGSQRSPGVVDCFGFQYPWRAVKEKKS